MLSFPTPRPETPPDSIDSEPSNMLNRNQQTPSKTARPNYIELPSRDTPPALGIDPPRPAKDGFE